MIMWLHSIYEAYHADIDLSLEDSRREVARWRTSWAITKRNDLSFWPFRGAIDSNSLSTTSDISNDFIS
jgi:hypothetical protein